MLSERSTIFFDLDGTLLDSQRGILKAFAHALSAEGRTLPPIEELRGALGPPLRISFARFLATEDPETIERAVKNYRAAYLEGLMFENEIYLGVPELLSDLQRRGRDLFVLTAKANVYAKRIVAHHGLSEYFLDVFGPELDGRFDKKSELLAHVLQERGIKKGDVIVVGDHANDVHAALANEAIPIGVTWGYGTAEELTESGSFALVHSPLALRELLMPEVPFTE